MTRREKLIQKIVRRLPEASYSDVRSLLVMFGWRHERTKGSHEVFTKPGERSLIVPLISGRKVGGYYLADLCEKLGLDRED